MLFNDLYCNVRNKLFLIDLADGEPLIQSVGRQLYLINCEEAVKNFLRAMVIHIRISMARQKTQSMVHIDRGERMVWLAFWKFFVLCRFFKALTQLVLSSFGLTLLDGICVIMIVINHIASSVFEDFLKLFHCISVPCLDCFWNPRPQSWKYVWRAFVFKNTLKKAAANTWYLIHMCPGKKLPFRRLFPKQLWYHKRVKVTKQLASPRPDDNIIHPVDCLSTW